MIKDKKIVIGVSGGIAAYKAVELVRLLVKAGADVQVAMTANAANFISPLTFEALSGKRVVSDMFDQGTHPLDHIKWGQETDLIIIAPATANFVAKMAGGIADDYFYHAHIVPQLPSLYKSDTTPSQPSVSFQSTNGPASVHKSPGLSVM